MTRTRSAAPIPTALASPAALRLLPASGPEPLFTRFTGVAPGPVGTVSLPVGEEMALVFDAADPTAVIEIVISRPPGRGSLALIIALLGSEAGALCVATGTRPGLVEILVPPAGRRWLAAAGRLALLQWCRRVHPTPTARALWVLEEAQLALSTALPLSLFEPLLDGLGTALGELRNRLDTVRAPAAWAALAHAEGNRPPRANDLTALVNRIRPLLPRPPDHRLPPICTNRDRRYSVEWDRVPAGVLDPAEETIQLTREGSGFTVTVPAQVNAPTRHEVVHARLFDTETATPFAVCSLYRSGEVYTGHLPRAPALPQTRLGVDVTCDLALPPRTPAQALIMRTRRDSFRTLYAERQAAAASAPVLYADQHPDARPAATRQHQPAFLAEHLLPLDALGPRPHQP